MARPVKLHRELRNVAFIRDDEVEMTREPQTMKVARTQSFDINHVSDAWFTIDYATVPDHAWGKELIGTRLPDGLIASSRSRASFFPSTRA